MVHHMSLSKTLRDNTYLPCVTLVIKGYYSVQLLLTVSIQVSLYTIITQNTMVTLVIPVYNGFIISSQTINEHLYFYQSYLPKLTIVMFCSSIISRQISHQSSQVHVSHTKCRSSQILNHSFHNKNYTHGYMYINIFFTLFAYFSVDSQWIRR